MQINPIWIYGPFDPQNVSSAIQPDWYMGWLDGVAPAHARLGDPRRSASDPEPVLPRRPAGRHHVRAALRLAVDRGPASPGPREHHLLDRPRQRPVRTALGVATITFYTILGLGGADDVLATTFGLSVNAVLWTFRFALFLLPPAVAWATYRLCKELSARDGLPVADKVHWRDIPGRLRHGVEPPGAGPAPTTDAERPRRRGRPGSGDRHRRAGPS